MKEIGYYRQGDMCIFDHDQEEYELLETLANKLMELSPNGFEYWVGDTYLDYGSRWMWTTILAEDTISPYFKSTYQAISPAEWLALMNGEDITEIARHVLLDKHCPDRIKSSRNIRSGKPICSSTFDSYFSASRKIGKKRPIEASVDPFSYDTKLIAKYVKETYDDSASARIRSFVHMSNAERYMHRNSLIYDSKNKLILFYDIETKEKTPIFKVIPQHSNIKKYGMYAPKEPILEPIDSYSDE